MLSLRALGNLSTDGAAARAVTQYFKDAYTDYYVKDLDNKHAGEWIGSGKKRLNLGKEVDKETLQLALTGEIDKSAVQNKGKAKRQMGWDLTFSAPKSVSVVWAFADPDHRKEIEEAHNQAIERAFQFLEDKVVTRRGKEGQIKESAQIVAASFLHFTSRQGDPQLHTHNVIPNFSVRLDGTVGTIESRSFYSYKMVAGAFYQAELAMKMQELGYSVEKSEKGTFILSDMDNKITTNFSKRSIDIQLMAKKMGIYHYSGKNIAVLSTRPNKTHTTFNERKEVWDLEMKHHNFNTVFKRHEHPLEIGRINHDQHLHEIKEALTRNESTFKEKDILRQIALSYMGKATVDDVFRTYDYFIANEDVLHLGLDHAKDMVYTTKEMIRIERNLIKSVDIFTQQDSFKVKPRIDKKIELNQEQLTSVQLACNGTGIVIIQGKAGTGKTTIMKTIGDSYKRSGYIVNCIALSGKASQILENETGFESLTIDKWLYKNEPKENSLLIIDELGMVGSRKMSDIFDVAIKNNIKVVGVGDEKQLQPIDAGGPLHMIDQHLIKTAPKCSSQLQTILRQKDDWMKEVVKNASLGRAKMALKDIYDKGNISFFETPEFARKELIDTYLKENSKGFDNAIILTHRRRDANIINNEIRKRLIEKKLIKENGLIHNNGMKNLEINKNDRIIFTKNNYFLNLRNGQNATVVNVNHRNKILDVRMDNGETKSINLNKYEGIDYGWAATTHKAQGATVDRTYVFGNSEDPMASRQATYVQISRAREKTNLYVVNGEIALELDAHEEQVMSKIDEQEALMKMQKFWSRDASKYTAVDIERKLDNSLTSDYHKFKERDQLKYEMGLNP